MVTMMATEGAVLWLPCTPSCSVHEQAEAQGGEVPSRSTEPQHLRPDPWEGPERAQGGGSALSLQSSRRCPGGPGLWGAPPSEHHGHPRRSAELRRVCSVTCSHHTAVGGGGTFLCTSMSLVCTPGSDPSSPCRLHGPHVGHCPWPRWGTKGRFAPCSWGTYGECHPEDSERAIFLHPCPGPVASGQDGHPSGQPILRNSRSWPRPCPSSSELPVKWPCSSRGLSMPTLPSPARVLPRVLG